MSQQTPAPLGVHDYNIKRVPYTLHFPVGTHLYMELYRAGGLDRAIRDGRAAVENARLDRSFQLVVRVCMLVWLVIPTAAWAVIVWNLSVHRGVWVAFSCYLLIFSIMTARAVMYAVLHEENCVTAMVMEVVNALAGIAVFVFFPPFVYGWAVGRILHAWSGNALRDVTTRLSSNEARRASAWYTVHHAIERGSVMLNLVTMVCSDDMAVQMLRNGVQFEGAPSRDDLETMQSELFAHVVHLTTVGNAIDAAAAKEAEHVHALVDRARQMLGTDNIRSARAVMSKLCT